MNEVGKLAGKAAGKVEYEAGKAKRTAGRAVNEVGKLAGKAGKETEKLAGKHLENPKWKGAVTLATGKGVHCVCSWLAQGGCGRHQKCLHSLNHTSTSDRSSLKPGHT